MLRRPVQKSAVVYNLHPRNIALRQRSAPQTTARHLIGLASASPVLITACPPKIWRSERRASSRRPASHCCLELKRKGKLWTVGMRAAPARACQHCKYYKSLHVCPPSVQVDASGRRPPLHPAKSVHGPARTRCQSDPGPIDRRVLPARRLTKAGRAVDSAVLPNGGGWTVENDTWKWRGFRLDLLSNVIVEMHQPFVRACFQHS